MTRRSQRHVGGRCRACNRIVGGTTIIVTDSGTTMTPYAIRDGSPVRLPQVTSREAGERAVLRAHHNWGQCSATRK